MSNIPDIGVVFDTNISISASDTDIELGETVTFKGILYAYFVNESSGNLDFCNTFDDVTLELYDDNTLLGTVTTDTFGEFSFQFVPEEEGTHQVQVVCVDGTNYNGCESSIISVVVGSVPSYDDIVLSADDSILSYYDGDSTTLRAQLMDGSSTASVSGVTVEFFNGSTSLGTSQTDSNGVATKTYTSTGAGNVSLKAECSNGSSTLVSETYEIKDALYYHADTVSSTTTININLPSSYELSMKWTRKSNSNSSGVLTCTNGSRNAYVGCYSSTGNYGIFFLSPNNEQNLSSCSTNVETSFKITYQNGSYVMTDGTNSKTVSDFAFSKISTIDGKANCPVKEVLVMPL